MTYKLYVDVTLEIQERKAIFTRGYWNFRQIEMDFSQEEEFTVGKLTELFENIVSEREIVSESVGNEYLEFIEKLVGAGMLYPVCDDSEFNKNKLLIITDDVSYLKKFTDETIGELNIIERNDIISNVFMNNTPEYIVQNPLLLFDIEKNIIEKYSEVEQIVILLPFVDDTFFKMCNRTFGKKIPIMYAFVDKDFIYLFDVSYKYTGCYECFSKNMVAKSKELVREGFDSKYNNLIGKVENRRDLNNYNLLIPLVIRNIQDYIEGGMIPCFGRIQTIFVPNLEIQYENLYRIPFCNSCGYISESKVIERNIKMHNLLSEVMC